MGSRRTFDVVGKQGAADSGFQVPGDNPVRQGFDFALHSDHVPEVTRNHQNGKGKAHGFNGSFVVRFTEESDVGRVCGDCHFQRSQNPVAFNAPVVSPVHFGHGIGVCPPVPPDVCRSSTDKQVGRQAFAVDFPDLCHLIFGSFGIAEEQFLK